LLFFAAALGLVWLAGFVDHLRELAPSFRLLAQIGGAVLLYAGGWRVAGFSSSAFGIFAQYLFVIVFVNAFSFLDGVDGLAAGITAVIALGYALVAGTALGALGYAVAWSLVGACAGFLFFNLPPAKMFMGDSGSTVLGFSHCGFAVLDALLVVTRRVARGRSPFRGTAGMLMIFYWLEDGRRGGWRLVVIC
jgi:UDP-N-acetylmuramyl pentapeptide phosphotransferase/UDP-N-acetylglucosamine-1-phosphate transferase